MLVVLRNALERSAAWSPRTARCARTCRRQQPLRRDHRPQRADEAGVRPDHPGGAEPTTILINGESGTGKELVARALHQNSPRARKPFVTVNCGNLPPSCSSRAVRPRQGRLHRRGLPKKGLFVADKGTLFLDEIGNIPLETQAKLLRVIQEREFMRLGGIETIKVDVRIIAATNVDLRRMVEEGASARTSTTG